MGRSISERGEDGTWGRWQDHNSEAKSEGLGPLTKEFPKSENHIAFLRGRASPAAQIG